MVINELQEKIAKGAKICLGHACIGAYSCFEIAVEALDSEGDGYCKIHAAYIKEEIPDHAICPKCCVIVWNKKHTRGHWKSKNPNCPRCKGTGIDPVCISKGNIG